MTRRRIGTPTRSEEEEGVLTMTMEPAGAAVGAAEIPSIAAEILIVLVPDVVSDDTADGGDPVAAGRTSRRGLFSKLWTRRSQRSD